MGEDHGTVGRFPNAEGGSGMNFLRTALMNVGWAVGWLFWPLTKVIAWLVPQQNGLIVIGARNGLYFMDNSRYLFEWLHEYRPQWRVVWVTWRISLVRSLRSKGHECLWMPTPRAIVTLLRAEVAIYCNRLLDVSIHPAFIANRTKLLSLSHGVGVKAKRCTRNDSLSWPLRNELDVARRRQTLAIASSAAMAEICARSQGLSSINYHLTGYPRNDLLFNDHSEGEAKWNQVAGNRKYSRTLLYAPTWRQGGTAQFFPFTDFSITDLRRWLVKTDTLLLVRPHVKDARGATFRDEAVEQLVEAGGEHVRALRTDICPDCYQIMRRVDILVTDYSSIYHDFLLLDRPILLVPYDYECYRAENGFQYSYHENLPGPVIESLEQFMAVLDEISEGNDLYRDSRQNLRDRLHDIRSGDACRRVAELVESKMLVPYSPARND